MGDGDSIVNIDRFLTSGLIEPIQHKTLDDEYLAYAKMNRDLFKAGLSVPAYD